ncbi:uncharacterized protein [Pocillopora verrucosa]|uniref:uncharacterized protein n=1 Tax=Pocillopora verrucosa TaxID=203993 RepID=UPI0027970BF2|nr:uncharacterized protein LOC131799565 [Pocillopora verrucosa]
MALKFGFILLLAGFVGILEVQAASVAIEKDIWNSLRQADQDKRNTDVDSLDTENLSTDEDFSYEDLASDVAFPRRAVCADAFSGLCKMLGKNKQCDKGRHTRFAMRYCHGSCPEYCK